MTETQRGTLSAANSKKTKPQDDEFGNDFLNSWKSGKMAEAAMDFDVESLPQKSNKAFKFNNMDDFGLGGDFGKLASFKVDMSDFDFSSPVKKNEKTKKGSNVDLDLGKQQSKDKFSFNFDFNELDKFNLDSELVKGEKMVIGDPSVDHDKVVDSKSATVTSSELPESHKSKIAPNAAIMASSRPPVDMEESEDGRNASCCSTSPNPSQCEISDKAVIPPKKHVAITEGKHNQFQTVIKQSKQSDGIHLTEACNENDTTSAPLEPGPDDCLAQKTHPEEKNKHSSFGSVKVNAFKEQDSSMRSVDSSKSRSSSPVNSAHSKDCVKRSDGISSGSSSKFQNQEVDINEGNGGNRSTYRAVDNKNDSESTCGPDNCGQNSGMIQTREKQDQVSKHFPLLLTRESKFPKKMQIQEKKSFPQQIKPLSSSQNCPSSLIEHISSAAEADNIVPKHTPSDPIKNVNEQLSAGKDSCRKDNNISLMVLRTTRTNNSISSSILDKERKLVASSERNLTAKLANSFTMDKSLTLKSSLKRKTLEKQNLQITSNAGAENIVPIHKPSETIKNVNAQLSADKDSCQKDNDISLMLPRITGANNTMSSSTLDKERKLAVSSDGTLTAKRANSFIIDESSTLKSSLKRKTLEEPITDPNIINPMKRKECTVERRILKETSQKPDTELVSMTELGTSEDDHCVDKLSFLDITNEVGCTMKHEVPTLVEHDGNVEKAEAYSKELDDVCSVLKKKHEEAKEILVRAIVNNNTLLMLNHPMFEEKIQALQRFIDNLHITESRKSFNHPAINE